MADRRQAERPASSSPSNSEGNGFNEPYLSQDLECRAWGRCCIGTGKGERQGQGGAPAPGGPGGRCDGIGACDCGRRLRARSEEHTSELQSLMRISYAVFCLKKKQRRTPVTYTTHIFN